MFLPLYFCGPAMPANVSDSDRSAGGLDDASTMLNDFGEISKRAFLLGTHQTAVARDIRGQNSCQPPLHVLAAQDARPSSWKLLNGICQNCGPMSRYAQVRNGVIFGSQIPRQGHPFYPHDRTLSGCPLRSETCHIRSPASQRWPHFRPDVGRRVQTRVAITARRRVAAGSPVARASGRCALRPCPHAQNPASRSTNQNAATTPTP
jgi:hypothetical protein